MWTCGQTSLSGRRVVWYPVSSGDDRIFPQTFMNLHASIALSKWFLQMSFSRLVHGSLSVHCRDPQSSAKVPKLPAHWEERFSRKGEAGNSCGNTWQGSEEFLRRCRLKMSQGPRLAQRNCRSKTSQLNRWRITKDHRSPWEFWCVEPCWLESVRGDEKIFEGESCGHCRHHRCNLCFVRGKQDAWNWEF